MFMIVMLHVLGQGVITHTKHLGTRYEVSWFLEIASLCAVNCYAIITGYVSVNSKKYRYGDLVTLLLRVFYYSILLAVIGYFAYLGEYSVRDVIKSFFCVFSGKYWYVTAYAGLFLLMPFLKKAINSMNRRQFKAMLLTGAFLFTVVPTFYRNDVYYLNMGYSFLWISYMFCVGAYIRKYVDFRRIKAWKMFVCYLCCIVGTLCFKYIYEVVFSARYNEFSSCFLIECYNFPLILLSGIFLFLMFAKIKVSSNAAKIISFLSPLAFSVYLIHAHPVVWEHFIVYHFIPIANSSLPIMVIKVFGYAIAIFCICLLIDIPRECIFKWLRIKERIRYFEEKHFKSIW